MYVTVYIMSFNSNLYFRREAKLQVYQNNFQVSNSFCFADSVGRGDTLHHATRGDSSHSPFREEKT